MPPSRSLQKWWFWCVRLTGNSESGKEVALTLKELSPCEASLSFRCPLHGRGQAGAAGRVHEEKRKVLEIRLRKMAFHHPLRICN